MRLFLNEYIFWTKLKYFPSGALYCMKHLFIIETTLVKNGCLFSNDHFLIIFGSKIVIWTNYCGKKPFISACPSWEDNVLLLRSTNTLDILEPLVMRTRTWTLHPITLWSLDCLQCHTMLLECGLGLVKVLAIVTWLQEVRFCFGSSCNYTINLSSRKFPQNIPISKRSTCQATCLVLYYMFSAQSDKLEVLNTGNNLGYSSRPTKKVKSHKISISVYKTFVRIRVQKWKFALQWAVKRPG